MGAELRGVRAEQDKLQADQREQQERFQASTSNPNLNPNPTSNLNPNPMTLGSKIPGSTISCSEARRCTDRHRHLEEYNRERLKEGNKKEIAGLTGLVTSTKRKSP